ncbi:MAG: DUF488 domain-containing protein [Candidatus Eisenbacteria bacterium]|uniref:DUF488 domain-containing protein n=1 Tax=Eiseniibacteriota bacterium TaxID=2212470 RepID=A0A933W2J7_UNCEI|nr:DUF488 domain-containing protein [Candidatus Eisenbacteria bacterium]
MKVFTIGFTEKSAERFFTLLRGSGAKRLLDVRLNNKSQLAGFAKRDDLRFFVKELAGMDYVHEPLLAPTQELLDRYKKLKGDWGVYESGFVALMESRQIEHKVSRDLVADSCMLCSEHLPTNCHRRLVVEYLGRHWGPMEVVHLR